ncbi:MAG: 30S ribosome-binding factor RbfA [Ignavibacteriales bacterium]|nr:30S ribosome-binding factor RbfA [Ignavibacteriales bacterium]
MSVRSEKVGSLIKEELSVLFQRNFSMADFGFLTVTEVLMSPDLKVAKVYVSIFGDEERKKKSFAKLEAQKSSIRSMLGHAVRLRFTPEIIFYLDETLDRAMKLENIFHKIHENDSKKEEEKSSTDA